MSETEREKVECEIILNPEIFREYEIDIYPETLLKKFDPSEFYTRKENVEKSIEEISELIYNVEHLKGVLGKDRIKLDRRWASKFEITTGYETINIIYPDTFGEKIKTNEYKKIESVEELINKLLELKDKSIEILETAKEREKYLLNKKIWVCIIKQEDEETEEEDEEDP